MERIWLQSYEPGVPAEIDPDEFRPLGEFFENCFRKYGDCKAFICMGAEMTYAELDTYSGHFSAYLQSVLKLPKGARVAIVLPNVLQYPVCMVGVLRAGYTVVNCNPLFTGRELAAQLRDSGAETVVILENFAHTLAQVIDKTAVKHVVVARLGDMLGFPRGMIVNFVAQYLKRIVPAWRLSDAVGFRDALAQGKNFGLQPVDVGHEDVAFLQYTGATTGLSKGAMLTHRNLLANMTQAHAWVRSTLVEKNELVVTALPLYHIFALTANCFIFLKIGACNLLITNPRDISRFVSELTRHPFSVLTGVNTLFNALLNNKDFCALDFSRVKVTLGGGTSVQKSVADRWMMVTGKPLIVAYGLAETSPAVTINPIHIPQFNGSIGLPIPSTEVAIRDDNGDDLPIGVAGELCIRGPQVMSGYYNQPEETARVFLPDGFLCTGDIAVIDDKGFLRIVDRKKDMILVSGFNVYPNEVEDVLAMHPGILEAAAIGVPSTDTGEAVKVFVVRKDPALTEKQIIAFCRKNLTRYKVPTQVEFRADLPKTNVGKILRRKLREDAVIEVSERL